MENGNRGKGNYLYVAGYFTAVKGKRFDGFPVVRVDMESGEVEKVVDGFNDAISHFVIDGDSVYVAGYFDKFKEKKFDGDAIVRVNMRTGELEKVVDGFNSVVNHFVIDGNYLYAAGGFTEFKGEEFDGRAVVKVNMETGELEKVVDGFNSWIEHFVIDGDSVYVGGVTRFKGKKFDGVAVVRVNMRTGEVEKVVYGFDDNIYHFVIDGNYLYGANHFAALKGKTVHQEANVVKVDMESGEVKKVVDGFNYPIRNFVIDGNYLYVAGEFDGFKEKQFKGLAAVVKVDMESGELKEVVIDGFNEAIAHFEMRSE